MHLHEYQAKAIFSAYGIPVPEGQVIRDATDAVSVAGMPGEEEWIVKAQVHAGGRGKAGGICRVAGREELVSEARRLLGMRLKTSQTGAAGLPVSTLYLERPVPVERELYLGALVDRGSERVVLMASAAGGMDIEELAREQPHAILAEAVHPCAGLRGYQCRNIAFGLGLSGEQIAEITRILRSVYRLVLEKDASLVEINPLGVTPEGHLMALDAKVDLDDNALYRHKDLASQRDVSQEDSRESRAREHGLNYITLNGNIACMVNGAGLAMATMDLIKLHGGEPANFLDVGGGVTAERVAEAFKIIVSDPGVRVILINIFGGIVRCDLIAEGIIRALREVDLQLPVVVRLEGTNVMQGRDLLAQSGLEVRTADDLAGAAQQAVMAADSA